jgi:hypothetical protein
VNPRPSAPSLRSATTTDDVPLKHVIDTYVHREQTITCVCGWHGSCAPGDRGTSPWTEHLALYRTKKR